jgi:hypothetical protein
MKASRSTEREALASRIEVAIDRVGSGSKVALAAGLARGSLTNTTRLLRSENGKATMTLDSIGRIAQVCGVSPAWLGFGEGTMLAGEVEADAFYSRGVRDGLNDAASLVNEMLQSVTDPQQRLAVEALAFRIQQRLNKVI